MCNSKAGVKWAIPKKFNFNSIPNTFLLGISRIMDIIDYV